MSSSLPSSNVNEWPLQAICPHVRSVSSSVSGKVVYKEECTQCFDTDRLPAGLNVCLQCFNGGCAHHSLRHVEVSRHPLVLHVVRTEKEHDKVDPVAAVAAGGQQNAPDKRNVLQRVVIEADDKAESGFDVQSSVLCLTCHYRIDLTAPSNSSLSTLVTSVLATALPSKTESASAWTEPVLPCEHTLTLQQVDRSVAPQIGKKGQAHCYACALTTNLWLCLSCGLLGCSRHQSGGVEGNGHALQHFNSQHHPLVVKLGTISAEGNAELFCYQCDASVQDEQLTNHLALFGLKLEGEATEETTAQKELEKNLTHDWSSVFEEAGEAQLVYGPGFTGLENIGSTCYMASSLQVLFALNPFYERYVVDGTSHLLTCTSSSPATCFHCQMAKLATGLHSGKYSLAPSAELLEQLRQEKELFQRTQQQLKQQVLQQDAKGDAATISSTTTTTTDINPSVLGKRKKPLQPGIPPRMLKKLIADKHRDFSTSQQQDASEYIKYFMEKVRQAEHVNAVDPTSIFNFKLEERFQCSNCHRVRYNSTVTNELQLPIPALNSESTSSTSTTSTAAADAAAASSSASSSSSSSSSSSASAPSGDAAKPTPRVPVSACLSEWSKPTPIESYKCPSCQSGSISTTTRFATFPKVLIVCMRRFVFENWVPAKLIVDIAFDDNLQLDLQSLKSAGKQPDEQLLPETSSSKPAATATPSPESQVNASLLSQLESMGLGFTHNACVRGLLAVRNAGVEVAVNWLFDHAADDNLNAPLSSSPADAASTSGDEPPADLVAAVEALGFPRRSALIALKQTSNNADRAVDWLFSHSAEEIEQAGAAATAASSSSSSSSSSPSSSTAAGDEKASGKYRMFAFITHLGKSTASGHYVAHILKDDRWVLFNDAKVSVATKPPFGTGYLYFFKRVDE